jgi:hypothetical protein
LISPVITDEDNMPLCAIPNADEIKQTLFSLGSDKSPGPDGMPALFYKHYWKVIRQDLIEAVTSFFHKRPHPHRDQPHIHYTHTKIGQSI